VNRRLATIIAAGAAGAFALAPVVNALPKGVRDTYNKSGNTVFECKDGDGNTTSTLTFHAPSDLWPPNHKYYEDITVTYTDAEGDPVDLTSDGTHNQYDESTDGAPEAKGSGNTSDDITSDDEQATVDKSDPNQPVATEASDSGTVTTDWDARAERAGTIKEGRIYTLHAIGTSSDGDSCEGSVEMRVPHDMSPKNR
jgi:hypothetical protein